MTPARRPTPDPAAAIRRLYYETTPATVQRDLTEAVDLFKQLPTDEARQRIAVYMDGLSQMRSEWAVRRRRGTRKR